MSGGEVPGSVAGNQRSTIRPSWWSQVFVVLGVWWAYDAVNNLNPLRAATAVAHGVSVVRLEAALHLDPERWLNRWLGAHLIVGRWIADYYGVAHFAVTASVLVFVWWRHPSKYRGLRNALLGINLVGFLVFWAYPVAPPRMLGGFGFVDVAAVAHSLGSGGGGALASQANEYAAMPSLHVAWALWCLFALWAVRTDRLTRVLAAAYAAFTVVVAMATANHYFLDVVAGAGTAVAALSVARWHGLVSPWRRIPRASACRPTKWARAVPLAARKAPDG